jgi:hypothetical protein
MRSYTCFRSGTGGHLEGYFNDVRVRSFVLTGAPFLLILMLLAARFFGTADSAAKSRRGADLQPLSVR